jgi:hypothetical protein
MLAALPEAVYRERVQMWLAPMLDWTLITMVT